MVVPLLRRLDVAVEHGAVGLQARAVDLAGDLGYALKGPESTVCVQCHEREDEGMSFAKLHDKHVKDKRYDCSWCHGFSRPERGLRMP